MTGPVGREWLARLGEFLVAGVLEPGALKGEELTKALRVRALKARL